jgi:uncharacterized repeat protein (TIGR02543 family)
VPNEVVSVSAVGQSGWVLDHWEGDLGGAEPAEMLIMDGNKSITAVFVERDYTLSVTSTGSGQVSVDPSKSSYEHGETVTLTATADPGWEFTGWTGDVTSTTNPLMHTMTGDATITANFSEATVSLQLGISGQGQVNVTPPKVEYLPGDQVTLHAVPAQNWLFDHWEGDAAGSTNPLILVLSADLQITAVFAQQSTFRSHIPFVNRS